MAGPRRIAREYPDTPLVGVGAIIIDADRVVLIRRGVPPSMGEWSIPGGLVRVGEGLLDAVAREALEETGLVVNPGPLVELVERVFPDEHSRVKYHYVVADYLCSIAEGTLQAGSDADDAKWAGFDELDTMGPAEITERVIRKAFQIKANESH